jgi:uncharacterized membrane protein
MATSQRSTFGLVALLGGSGVLHFAAPEPYDSIVPGVLPGSARTWTYLSGVAELVVASALAVPRFRRLGGLLAALLFIGKPLPARLIAFSRLPLQVPLVLWALRVRRSGQ